MSWSQIYERKCYTHAHTLNDLSKLKKKKVTWGGWVSEVPRSIGNGTDGLKAPFGQLWQKC